MFILDKELYIAEGGNRSVYTHPTEEHLCIKVLHSNCGTEPMRRQKREIKVYKKIQRRKIFSKNLAKYFGSIETNLGRGYVFEKVTDYDGKLSIDVHSYLASLLERDDQMVKALKSLGEFVVRERLFFGDPREGNILCRKTSEDSHELVIVDGLGDHILIPVSNWVPSVERARIAKRWNGYLAKQVSKLIPWIEEDDLKVTDSINRSRES